MKKKSKILICYNEPVRLYENYIGKGFSSSEENIDLSESEFTKNLEAIVKALKNKFTEVDAYPVSPDIKTTITYLKEYNPDIVFNFVESVEGNSHYESYIAGVYDILRIPYTGNTAIALGNCLIKSRTKHILEAYNVRIPKFYHARYNDKNKTLDDFNLDYPVIAKLIHEDASIGISEYSVIYNKKDLKKRLKFLFQNYKQDVIVEEYIDGRELNISILGDEILPISEIVFENLPDKYPKIITYEAKWSPDSIYYKNTIPSCPAKLDKTLSEKIKQVAYDSFTALGCRDYARVDIRLDKKNVPYVIEVNPNPDISVDSGFVRSATAANLSYDELLNKIAGFAIGRM
jgi:D-alanine-D-alanine ligase